MQAERREQSQAFGGIPLAPQEALERIMQDTRGVGAEAVIEAVGIGPTLEQAVEIIRSDGRMSALGVPQKDAVMPFHRVQ